MIATGRCKRDRRCRTTSQAEVRFVIGARETARRAKYFWSNCLWQSQEKPRGNGVATMTHRQPRNSPRVRSSRSNRAGQFEP